MNTSNNALTEAVYYILLALVEPLHGYGIMQQTARLSNGRLVISAGTLYGAISTLLEKGWIEQVANVADSRRKEYIITSAGRMVLTEELERLRELVKNGDAILNSVRY
jgi:DNA-binding PadR family transcriptional regulator